MTTKGIGTVQFQRRKVKRLLSLVFFILLVFLSIRYVDFNFIVLLKSIPTFLTFIFVDFFPPNISDIKDYIRPVLDTLFVAVVATCISSFLAMGAGLLMAHNTTPHPTVRVISRGVVTFFRSIPFLLWASILVIILGVGVMPGIIGLILFGSAFLARVYAESIEEIGLESVEALEAVGATYAQKIKHAIIPQFLPSFISWTLFMFEINIRASAILGIVGAGGVGILIKQTMDLFQYGKTATVISIMILLILAVELVTNRLRERLI